jgi:hypothetical protein
MASIQFTLHSNDNDVVPLVKFTLRGDTLLTISIITTQQPTRKGIQRALASIGFKRRSDLHVDRNGADILTALLLIALRKEFGDTITTEKRIEGMTLVGTTDAKDLPRVNWSRP